MHMQGSINGVWQPMNAIEAGKHVRGDVRTKPTVTVPRDTDVKPKKTK
jgi:hypothetical protein